MPNERLKELYIHGLKDLFNADNQLLKALPKIAKAAAGLNGVVAAPHMAVIMWMASSRRVTRKFLIPSCLRWIGRLATGMMAYVYVGVFLTWR